MMGFWDWDGKENKNDWEEGEWIGVWVEKEDRGEEEEGDAKEKEPSGQLGGIRTNPNFFIFFLA